MQACEAKSKSGEACRMRPLKGGSLCFRHDPSKREQALEASRLGGHTRIMPDVSLEAFSLTDSKDALRIVAETIQRVKAGKLHPAVANSIAILVQTFLRSLELVKHTEAVTEDRTKETELEQDKPILSPQENRLLSYFYCNGLARTRFAQKNNIPIPLSDPVMIDGRVEWPAFFQAVEKAGFRNSLPQAIKDYIQEKENPPPRPS